MLVVAGSVHSVLLRGDGGVVAVGSNSSGQCALPADAARGPRRGDGQPSGSASSAYKAFGIKSSCFSSTEFAGNIANINFEKLRQISANKYVKI